MEWNGVSIVIFEILSILLQISAVVFNGAIICTLWKKSLFRCPSNKLVFSLCLSQLLVSILSFLISVTQSVLTSTMRSKGSIVIRNMSPLHSSGTVPEQPPVLMSLDTDHQSESFIPPLLNGRISYVLCHIQLYATFIVSIGASITIALISVDRYITIALPMKYKSIVTPGRCTFLISFSWLVSVLITLLPPLLIFGNETIQHGPIAIPKGGLGLYFGIIFTIVTTIVLSAMIISYNRIFKIAREKCQKVQIGHFTSPLSSISSDWPSSAYSSQHLQGQRSTNPEFRINSPQRMSNSLLQYVLLANLGKQVISTTETVGLREPFIVNFDEVGETEPEGVKDVTLVTLPGSPRSRCRSVVQNHRNKNSIGQSTVQLTSKIPPIAFLKQSTRSGVRKWKTFLQHNYNSPRKTVSTIIALIGSMTLTQVPLTLSLYATSRSPIHFYIIFKILVGLNSISCPILYGFLNRTIRVYLWKFLRIRRRYSAKAFSVVGSKTFDSRKASVSSGSSQIVRRDSHEIIEGSGVVVNKPSLPLNICHNNNEIFEIKMETETEIVKIESSSSSNNPTAGGEVFEVKEVVVSIDSKIENMDPMSHFTEKSDVIVGKEDNESDLSSSFPRKPSQDSGADVSFSEDEEEMKTEDVGSRMRVRVAPRLPLLEGTNENEDGSQRTTTQVLLTVSISPDFEYMDEMGSETDSEPDDLFDFDEDEYFERMKDIIKKKFSLTDEDIGNIRSMDLDCFNEDDEEERVIEEIGHPIEV